MSQYATRTLLAAGIAVLLSASPAAAADSADAQPGAPGTATALANLNRTPQAAPGTFSDHVAAVLKTRHETAKNSISNVR